jgi:hypothetical protein
VTANQVHAISANGTTDDLFLFDGVASLPRAASDPLPEDFEKTVVARVLKNVQDGLHSAVVLYGPINAGLFWQLSKTCLFGRQNKNNQECLKCVVG